MECPLSRACADLVSQTLSCDASATPLRQYVVRTRVATFTIGRFYRPPVNVHGLRFYLYTGSKSQITLILPSDGTCTQVEPRPGAPGVGPSSSSSSMVLRTLLLRRVVFHPRWRTKFMKTPAKSCAFTLREP